jgi:hypothetical protein
LDELTRGAQVSFDIELEPRLEDPSCRSAKATVLLPEELGSAREAPPEAGWIDPLTSSWRQVERLEEPGCRFTYGVELLRAQPGSGESALTSQGAAEASHSSNDIARVETEQVDLRTEPLVLRRVLDFPQAQSCAGLLPGVEGHFRCEDTWSVELHPAGGEP